VPTSELAPLFLTRESSTELFRDLCTVGGFTGYMLAAGCSACGGLRRACEPDAQ
jgi:hypothetical protein